MLRNKTWIEACMDDSIDHMDREEIKNLIGYVEPSPHGWFLRKIEWTVTCANEGSWYTTDKQTDAIVVAGIEQILTLLLRKKK